MQKVIEHLRSHRPDGPTSGTAPFTAMGYLKNHLLREDKQELLGLIEDYRQGLLPLIVPLT